MKKYLFLLVSIMAVNVLVAQNALKVGDKAPQFSAQSDTGELWNISDYLGKKNIVMFFYPAAMTGGCTAQACSYRDDIEKLSSADAIVVGISGDDVAALKVFKKAHNLNYPLLSDFDGAVATKFGVPTGAGGSLTRVVDDTEFILNRGVTAQRWTFVIGKDGNIKYVNQQVNAQNDSKEVLQILSQK